tara:strand:+ start:204 stop:788 length:585 start_codon:yes stop_codon:yes gene_type:complete
MKNFRILERQIKESVDCKKKLLGSSKEIQKAIELIFNCLKKGGKVLICGNGGSAGDAQHLAAEFLIRLRPNVNRKPMPAISLALDSSTLTACSNDYSFKKIFSRPFEALANKNDILIAITTSGNSKNIIEVLKSAKKKKIKSIGFLGKGGGKTKKYCSTKILIQSKTTARIQEAHIFLGHFIVEQVENKLFKLK